MSEPHSIANWEEMKYERLLKDLGIEGVRIADLLQKADDPFTSSTTGAYNVLYGARVYDNLYRQSPAWQATPKVDFMTAKSGVRLLTADPVNITGVTETGALGETDKPDVIEYNMSIKRENVTWDISEIGEIRSKAEDGVGGDAAAWLMKAMADYFVSAVDVKMLSQNGALAGNHVESYDRIIGSSTEFDTCTDSTNTAYDAGDLDYLGNDRDSATTTDATISYSASDRALSIGLIDSTMISAEAAGFNRARGVILTKHDTFMDWANLLSSQQRFDDFKEVTATVNGVEGAVGRPGGFKVAMWQGVPLMVDKNVVSETSGKGRIYGIDMDGVEFRLATPVRHLVSPVGNAILHDSFVERHSLDLAGELVATAFAKHWKIRDLA